jgi:hypothetical protein
MPALKFALSFGLLALAMAARAQMPSIQMPATIVGSIEVISNISDVVDPVTNTIQDPTVVTGTYRLVYTVPAGRVLRLTDLGLTTARANMEFPCIMEIWRGTPDGPTGRAWSRIKVFGNQTYDRSWISGPGFAAGSSIWVRFFWGAAEGLCDRSNSAVPAELRFALRGYLFTVP